MASSSILIATWNGEKFIHDQLTSIISQTRKPDEIIISDDGSTDKTVEIAYNMLIQSEIPFKIIANKNQHGSSTNFCNGLSHCKEDLVFFCDQDDQWHQNKIDILASIMESNDSLAYCFTDAELVNPDLSRIGVNLWESLRLKRDIEKFNHSTDQMSILFRQPLVTGATSVFRRHALIACQPFPSEWIHDRWCSTLLATRCHRGVAVDTPTILYRQHQQQQVGGIGMTSFQRWQHIHHTTAEQLEMESSMWKQLSSRTVESSIWGERILGKIEHFKIRAKIRKSSSIRAAYLSIRELVNHRYQYSNGIHSFMRDIFRPGRKS